MMYLFQLMIFQFAAQKLPEGMSQQPMSVFFSTALPLARPMESEQCQKAGQMPKS